MKILLGADHGGFNVKERVKKILQDREIAVEDFGCDNQDSVDYPDYAVEVASRVSKDPEEFEGVLVCTTGLGMSMAANRFPNIRAALCLNPAMASAARLHNNANILVLSNDYIQPEDTEAILDAWLDNSFSEAERHARRLAKIDTAGFVAHDLATVQSVDPEICAAVAEEAERQNTTVNLIASENVVSRAVAEVQGSVMTNKYAEGYPDKRWYNGCEYMDDAEILAIDRAKQLFGAEHVNVQPHCGSSANMAVYFSMLEPGDTILAMDLSHGGHLTHGHAVNFSGRLFKCVSYGVSAGTGLIDYDAMEELAKKTRPRMIIAGASAYSRILDFERFRAAADSVGAYLMVDMAHIAGLVASDCHPSPVPHADFVTTTTHKTLRGPRGGMVMCRREFAGAIDKQVFPGLQGGPLMNEIAAKAVCLHEALQPGFKQYGRQIIKNAAAICSSLQSSGYEIVAGGTDNHLMLVDLSPRGITGRDAALALDKAGLIVNKNSIPYDSKSPAVTSGIRIGTPTVTSIGMQEQEMEEIASMIDNVICNMDDDTLILDTRRRVMKLRSQFRTVPVPQW